MYSSNDRCDNRAILEALEPRLLLSGTLYVVNSVADSVSVNGVVTLREALNAANTNTQSGDAAPGSSSQIDDIVFDTSALQAEALMADPTWTPAEGFTIEINRWMDITDDLRIHGPGQDVLTIDVVAAYRAFLISGE